MDKGERLMAEVLAEAGVSGPQSSESRSVQNAGPSLKPMTAASSGAQHVGKTDRLRRR